jgi:toxin ParE1/3/4
VSPPIDLRTEAASDIAKAARWYGRKSPALSLRFRREVRETLGRIEESPLAYPIDQADVRRAALRHFPYSIFYFCLPEATIVIACLHQRMHPRRWWSRRRDDPFG